MSCLGCYKTSCDFVPNCMDSILSTDMVERAVARQLAIARALVRRRWFLSPPLARPGGERLRGGEPESMQEHSVRSRVRRVHRCPGRARRSMRLTKLGTGLLALAGGVAPSAQAAITFVQANAAVPQTAKTTVTVPYTAVQAAGNLNVVVSDGTTAPWSSRRSPTRRATSTSSAVGPTADSRDVEPGD